MIYFDRFIIIIKFKKNKCLFDFVICFLNCLFANFFNFYLNYFYCLVMRYEEMEI